MAERPLKTGTFSTPVSHYEATDGLSLGAIDYNRESSGVSRQRWQIQQHSTINELVRRVSKRWFFPERMERGRRKRRHQHRRLEPFSRFMWPKHWRYILVLLCLGSKETFPDVVMLCKVVEHAKSYVFIEPQKVLKRLFGPGKCNWSAASWFNENIFR